jgi:flavin reductase (DIM6/NTAB) family NADH-FMN oxidoreductase RutF
MAQKMHDCGAAFPADVSELAAVGLTAVPSHGVAPPRIAEAPVAFECVLHEKLETESRYVFIGRIVRLAARAGLIDTQAWRVNLREYHPVARFGASFYTRTNDRFSLSEASAERAPTSTPIDEL